MTYHEPMKIYGYKLTEQVKHIDDYNADTDDAIPISPEEDICEACHLYTDTAGNSYVGFDLSLGMPQTEMDSFLDFVAPENRRIYKVLAN